MTTHADRPRRPRLVRCVALAVALSYVLLLTIMYSIQDRLIFPGRATQGTAEARVVPPIGSELVTLKAHRGERVVALFGPALNANGSPRADASSRPTILYFYGNGQSLSQSLSRFSTFRRLGANVMIPDYLGYGLSGGKAGESGCYATADAAYDHLRGRSDIDPSRIVVIGRSLGGAVAIDLSSRRDVAGLVVLCSFTSMAEVVRGKHPYLPVSLLLSHRFEKRLEDRQGPRADLARPRPGG